MIRAEGNENVEITIQFLNCASRVTHASDKLSLIGKRSAAREEKEKRRDQSENYSATKYNNRETVGGDSYDTDGSNYANATFND